MLFSVSERLVSGLHTVANTTRIAYASHDTLEVLFGWILSRRIEGRTQLSLVKAWKFGARYSIPRFQNDVMRRLVDILNSNPVELDAVREAYYVSPLAAYPPQCALNGAMLKLLREALLIKLVHDATFFVSPAQFEAEPAHKELATVEEFQKDLAYAVCVGYYMKFPESKTVLFHQHLVKV
jgi:hypothetical protein